MNLLKTPHQMLLEEAGAKTHAPTEMLKTPQQLLMEESGLPQQFADGGQVQMSIGDMIAAMIAQGQTPQKFAAGSQVKNIATQSAFTLPFIQEDAQQIAENIKAKKYKEAAAGTAGVGYSAFAPFNPLTALISGMTYSPETGDATLDAYRKKQAEHEAAISARARALSPVFKGNEPITLEEMQREVFGYPNIPLPKVK
tara:strand:- start:2952 stop:3545 length:594 start_codon:yes stop_codon:yes gene_type:complete